MAPLLRVLSAIIFNFNANAESSLRLVRRDYSHAANKSLFLRNRRGAVALMVAASMVVLFGAAAMALDLANAFYIKSMDQRIADQSAMGAALAYDENTASLQNTASSLAISNGAGNASVVASVVAAPSGDGNNAVKVVVTSQIPLSGFGRVLAGSSANTISQTGFSVSATAYAEIQDESSPCIIALGATGSSSSTLTVQGTGGVNITATSCAVGANGSIAPSSGAHMSASAFYATGTISTGTASGASLTTSPTASALFANSSAQKDPFASAGVFSRISTVADMSAPLFPSVGSAPTGGSSESCSGTLTLPPGSYGEVSASYYPTCNTITFTGGTATTSIASIQIAGPSMTINFGPGIYKIGGISNVGGSQTVMINLTGNPTLYIWNGIANDSGASTVFNGPATYYVQGGIVNSSGPGSLTFNNGTSTTTSAFTIAGGIHTGSGTTTFPNGTYVITSGDGTASIDSGSGTTVFGSGSYQIACQSGAGISLGGGGHLTIGAALNSTSVFQIFNANSNGSACGSAISTGGGSSFTIGSFNNYDLDGGISLQGSASLGTGIYTVNGALNASASGGGSISGSSISIIAAGAVSFGAGYSSVDITAPSSITSSTYGNATTIALASESAAASSVTSGASNTEVTGAVYLPNSPLTLNGAGNLNGGGNCLVVVAQSIAQSGGASLSTSCASLGNSGAGGSISLVQ